MNIKRALSVFVLSVVMLVWALTGCTSLNSTVFKSEKLATDSAYAAFKGWVAYYKAATNGAATQKVNSLNRQTVTVNSTVKNFALSVYTLDALRESYATNSTLKEPVLAALDTVNQQSSNIVWLVKHLKTQN